jgi:hypothetical protein
MIPPFAVARHCLLLVFGPHVPMWGGWEYCKGMGDPLVLLESKAN